MNRCQSCGMVLSSREDYGLFADGTMNADYCRYCFAESRFKFPTLEQQVESNLEDLDRWNGENGTDLSVEVAREQLSGFLPRLKRWMPLCDRISWIMERCGYVVLSTLHDGYPRPVPVDIVRCDGIDRIWMTTSVGSVKVGDLMDDERAGVCLVRNGDSITFTGHARVHRDLETKKRFWNDWLIRYYPAGIDDSDCCIIEFVPECAKTWIDGADGFVDLTGPECDR